MKQLLCLTALLALAVARPELYKETEDFQYARSSSDEGTKSGYYGAKRGNMGGNYEKAHNMDHLAQNQMSGLVRQVDGEVGESAKLSAGHVFADASSRGIYGSGQYDTSNLHGRNFQEGVREGYVADSHSALASHNSGYVAGQAAQHSSGYNSHAASSSYTGYQGTKSAQALHSANLQSTGAVAGAYGSDSGYSAGQASQYQYHGAHNSDYAVVPTNRLIYTAPARVVLRPGGRVAVPVGVQSYDASHSASTMDHNSINTDAEVLTVPDHVLYKPNTGSKYYESSSSYKKHWENHDTKAEVIPLAIPTANPFAVNSELYDESQALHTAAHNALNSNVYSGYNDNVNSASRQSGYGAAHDAQFASGLNSNTHGAYVGGVSNGLESTIPATKSHSSSYSYHKAWERQGDPYVITPVGGVENAASQRLTATSANQGYSSSQQYGTKSSAQRYQANGIDCDCDENGQIRVPRSVDHNHHDDQQSQDFGQQSQTELDDLTQQAQTGWNHQRRGAAEDLVDFGQQAQQTGDLTQQAQTGWDRQHNRGSDKLEESGQQNKKWWGDLSQQSQAAYDRQRERTAAGWERHHHRGSEKLEEFGQQNQKEWSDLSQQTQAAYDRQRERTAAGWEQQRNRGSDKLEEFAQQNQKEWNDISEQTQSAFDHQRARTSAGWESQRNKASDNLEDLGQQTQKEWGDLTQQAQTGWNHQRNSASDKLKDFGRETQNQRDDLTQQTQIVIGQQAELPWYTRETETPFTNPNENKDIVKKPQTPWHFEDLEKKVRHTVVEHNQNSTFGDQQVQTHTDFRNLHNFDQNNNDGRYNFQSIHFRSIFDPNENKDIVKKPQTPWPFEDLEKKGRHTVVEHNQNSTFDDQQVQTDFENLHNLDANNNDGQYNFKNETYHIYKQYENDGIQNIYDFDQHNDNWQLFRDDDDVKQQTHQPWDGFFHYSNINKDVSSDKRVEPVTEYQTDDDTQQIVKNPLSGIYTNPWTSIRETQRNLNRNDETQKRSQTNENSSWNTWQEQNTNGRSNGWTQRPQQGVTLQSLWDKINKFDQTSTTNINNTRKENGYRTESSTTYQQNTNQYGTNRYNHWIPMVGDPGILTSVPNNTLKPKQNTQNDNTRPVDNADVGRGDIGSGMSSKITTTEKSFVSGYSQGFPIFTEDKREKSPEEIEALSLTISANSANKSAVFNASQNQNSEETLKVLSLEKQKWSDEKQRHDSHHIFTSNKTQIFTEDKREKSPEETEALSLTIFANSANKSAVFNASQNLNSEETLKVLSLEQQKWSNEKQRDIFTSNKTVNSTTEGERVGTLDVGTQQTGSSFYANKPIMEPAYNSGNQLFTNEHQSTDETDHNLQQQMEEKNTFDQQSHNVWREDFENGQEFRNSKQKNERAWGQDLADFGLQEQLAWRQEGLQQQYTQQQENLGVLDRSHTGQHQNWDFYNQRYHTTLATGKNNGEELKAAPEPTPQLETSKKVSDSQSTKPDDQVISAPIEPTEKSGFWKSMGQKLTSAKDKVVSWFKPT